MRTFSMLVLLVLTLFLTSCSERVESRPQFIFKQGSDKSVVAEYGKIKITQKELMTGIYDDIYDLQKKIFDKKMSRLKAILLKKMMESDPNYKGLSNDQFLTKYIAKNINVSKKDIEKFIKEKKIPKEQLNDMVRGQIKKYLLMQKKKQAVEEWMANKTQKTPVVVYFKKPLRPVFDVKITDRDPSWGSKSAKVTIVEFSDFQCPFCGKAAKVMKKLKQHYGKDKIRIVFKNFPLPFHPQAKPAALAALCAKEQGQSYFWSFYDRLFSHQNGLNKDNYKKFAKEIGLNVKKFGECMSSGRHQDKLADDIKQGSDDLHIKSTPTFYVNGQLMNGAYPFEEFKQIIDEQLKL
jgi:protein-disulfide isomerase